MKDLRSIAETAANWWADVACGNNTLHRDGTDELPNFFAGLIADELKKSTNDDVKEQFKGKLADAIYETLSTRKHLRCGVIITLMLRWVVLRRNAGYRSITFLGKRRCTYRHMIPMTA